MHSTRLLLLLACVVAATTIARPAAAQLACGQPVSSGATPTASDALFTLRAALGSEECEACVCDVDSSGGASPISASDALRVLRRAVGQSVELTCPPCEVDCVNAEAPACAGTCPTSTTCVQDPSSGNCACRNDCEVSDAPACGGSCAAAEPVDLECRAFTITADAESTSACLCLPPGIEVCVDAGAPTCAGLCRPGAACVPGDAGCVCDDQPRQGPCDSATAPACGGTCGADLICIEQQGACACADAASHAETCNDADAPECAGACASGRFCAVTTLAGCECLQGCDVSAPPACGGVCDVEGQVCTDIVASLGGSDLHICQCR
jgi:hypothetical protein